jgi:hypothetical protein
MVLVELLGFPLDGCIKGVHDLNWPQYMFYFLHSILHYLHRNIQVLNATFVSNKD